MRTRKTKSISISLFKINGFFLTDTIHTILDHTKSSDITYVVSFLTYKKNRIHINKKMNILPTKGYTINQSKKDVFNENKIKEEMKKNCNVTIEELSKLTGLSMYIIKNKFYMKIRREQYPKVLRWSKNKK